MVAETMLKLIKLLKKCPGAIPYDGDASSQVMFRLYKNRHIRLGVADTDVSNWPHCFIEFNYIPLEYYMHDLGIADVWHEGSKSFHRAKLLKKITEEEALHSPRY